MHLIEASGHAKVLAFKLGEPDPILGSKLTIEFPHCCAATPRCAIRIDYRTSNEASALQWLEPAQTSGPHPFMYTPGAGHPGAQLDSDAGQSGHPRHLQRAHPRRRRSSSP